MGQRRELFFRLLVSLGLCLGAPIPTLADTLIVNALVLDGTGSPGQRGSIRIIGDQISDVGNLTARATDTLVDAQGLVLSPGFIDTHSHADEHLLTQRNAAPKITQGITTVIVGQDGSSPYPLKNFFQALEQTPAKINVAAYVGHNTLRDAVMGKGNREEATPSQMQSMASLLGSELNSGAIGLSTGLEYEPGIYSSRAEVLLLAQQTAQRGGRYISHLRSEDRWFEDSIEEIIEIGRFTGMPVQISHIKLAMKRLWGSAPVLLKQLDAARDEGIDITADIYPYTFWQSHMMVLLPERDPLDMSAIDLVMRELAPPEGIIFTHFPAEPSYVGKTLVEIAGLRNESPGEAFSQLAQQSIAYEEKTGQSGDMMIGTSMDEGDLRDLMAWPHTNICTDGGLQDRHPRGAGSFPRVLGYYARDAALFSLESAVQKMTALPAQHLGMKDRGMIKPGYKADLVLFDPATVIDRATTSEPFLAAVGISDVWVNGTRVMENGHPTEAYPGRVVRRTSTP